MADGKIHIDTTLETKGVIKGLKDISDMAQRTAKNLKDSMKTNSSAKELERELKEQQKIIQQAEKEIEKYQQQLDAIDSSKAVTSLQQKINAENQVIENARQQLERYLAQLNKVQEKTAGIKAKTAAQVRSDYDPEMLKANPNLEAYETKKRLIKDPDYQSSKMEEQELINKMEEYDKKVEKAASSVTDLEEKLRKAKAEQAELAGGKISKFTKALEDAKNKAGILSQKLAKVKETADVSKPAEKSAASLKKADKSAKNFGTNVTKSAESGIKRLAKLSLAIFSVRSAYVFARRAADEYLQTNEQLAGQVQGIWNALAQAIGPIVQTIVGWVVMLVSYINAFVKALTGIDFVARGNAAALNKQSAAAGKLAEETEKANREISGFDELNIVDKDKENSGSGSGSSVPQLDLPDVNIDGIKKKLEKLFEPISKAWDKYGKGFINSFKYGLGEVWELVKSIGRSFEEVWLNGTGEKTVSLILLILTNIFKTIGNIAHNFRMAWEEAGTGTRIIQNLWDAINVLLGGVKAVSSAIEKWSRDLDFKPLLKSVAELTASMKPLTEIISESLRWSFENVLLPLGKWTIEQGMPALIQLLAVAFEGLATVMDSLKAPAQFIWNEFLAPLAAWTGDSIIKVLNGLGSALEWIVANGNAARVLSKLSGTMGVLAGAAAALGLAFGALNTVIPIIVTFGTIISNWGITAVLEHLVMTLFPGLSSAIAALVSPIGIAIAAITAFGAAFGYLYTTSSEFRDNINEIFLSIAENIGGVVTGLVEIIQTIWTQGIQPVVDNAVSAFQYLWDNGLAMLIENVSVFALQFINFIMSIWNNAVNPLINLFLTVFLPVITTVWNGILAVVTPIIKKIMEYINLFMEVLNILMELLNDNVLPIFKTVFDGVGEAVRMFFDFAKPFIDDFMKILGNAVTFAMDFFLAPLTKVFKLVVSVIRDIMDPIKQTMNGVKKMLQGIIDFVLGVFSGDWKRAWEGIKKIFSGMWDSLKGIVRIAWNGILSLFGNAGKIFSGVVDGITSVFRNIVNCIVDGINRVIRIPFDKINGLLNSIHDFSILGKKPFSGMWSYNPLPVPQIPRLAKGGIVNNPGPGVNMGSYIAGERGPEAVVPINDSEFVEEFAMKVAGYIGTGKLDKVVELLIQIINEIREKDLHIGDKDIGEANNRYRERKGISFSNI